jgi:hypothetical protein
MSENLLTPSVIKLFGRELRDLQFKYDPQTVVRGFDNFLQKQLQNGGAAPPSFHIEGNTTDNGPTITHVRIPRNHMLVPGTVLKAPGILDDDTEVLYVGRDNKMIGISVPAIKDQKDAKIEAIPSNQHPRLARIYAFSFEGAYYGVPRPPIFLVHGGGIPVDSSSNTWSKFESSGVMAREWDFSSQDGNDLRYWEYEKGDFSIRLDFEAGPFEQILLAAALRAGADMADRASPRSGASLAGASLAGASLSGASLSGASLSGASLSGASLSGASLRNGR